MKVLISRSLEVFKELKFEFLWYESAIKLLINRVQISVQSKWKFTGHHTLCVANEIDHLQVILIKEQKFWDNWSYIQFCVPLSILPVYNCHGKSLVDLLWRGEGQKKVRVTTTVLFQWVQKCGLNLILLQVRIYIL